MDEELLQEVLNLYEESYLDEKSMKNKATPEAAVKAFLTHVHDFLPPDAIEVMAALTGSGVDDEEDQEAGGEVGDAFLRDLWQERYQHYFVVVQEEELMEEGCCEVCERHVRLTRHHLIPRETHKTMAKRGIAKEVLNLTSPVCRLCHSAIHRIFTNDQLALSFNTIEALMTDAAFFKYAKWAASLSDRRYAGSVRV